MRSVPLGYGVCRGSVCAANIFISARPGQTSADMGTPKKALNITLFRNGDGNFPGARLAVEPSSKQINWDVFMDKVTERVKLASGTAYRLYTTEGASLSALGDLEDSKAYVAAGREPFKPMPYDSILHPRAKERIHEETKKKVAIAPPPRVVRSGRAMRTATLKPKTIAVAPNGDPFGKNIKLVLNPRTSSSFDQLLRNLSDRFGFAVNHLFTAEGEEVTDLGSLDDSGQYVAANKAFKKMAYFGTEQGGAAAAAADLGQSKVRSKTLPPTYAGKAGHIPRKENTMPPRKPLNAASDGKPEITSKKFDKLEKEIKVTVQSPKDLDALWKALDFNGNGVVSLAEIDKMVVEKYPLLNSKPALMRAYKKTTLKDGDGDAWVERDELPALLRNLFYFNKLFVVFDEIDKDDDRRMDLAEFKAGLQHIGMKLTPEEAADEFATIDENGGGLVLFDEFCTWVARRQCPVDGDVETAYTSANKKMGTSGADAKKGKGAAAASGASSSKNSSAIMAKYSKVDKEIRAMLSNPSALDALWKALDFNGNGLVSLAEIDKWVVEKYSLLNSKPALMRAYKKTTLKDGDGDAWVERNEVPSLVRNVLYFNKLFAVFDEIDKDDDRRMDLAEFKAGVQIVGIALTPAQLDAEFKKIDTNGGGLVLFDEFCAWVAQNQCPIDGEVMSEYTDSSSKMGTSAAGAKSGKPTAARIKEDPAKQAELSKFDKLEKEFKAMLASADKLKAIWSSLDFNGNSLVSLAEIDKWVVEKYPLLNNKPALMRAYQRTTLKDGDGDAWVERHELVALLRNLFYFNKLFQLFDLIDTGDDRRVDAKEFAAGAALLNLKLSAAQAEVEFKQIDVNKGGLVLFDEFCEWAAKKLMPIEENVAVEFRKKLADSDKLQGYNVTVETGDQETAGTDAKVYITIVGSKGNSGRQLLTESSDNFQPGSSDLFALESSAVGDIKKIVIEHDNAGAASAWYLKRISIRDVITGKTCYFHANRWLADDRGDMKTCIELPASSSATAEAKGSKGNKAGDDIFAAKSKKNEAEVVDDSEETREDRPVDGRRAERVDED